MEVQLTAREMFEELGYFYDKHYDCIIVFETWLDGFGELQYREIIRFNLIDKKRWVFKPMKRLTLNLKNEFSINLFKAINKQIEELEGNNDN